MKRSKPGPRQTAKDAEKTVCSNLRYEGLTVAEATRRTMRGKPKEDPKRKRNFTYNI